VSVVDTGVNDGHGDAVARDGQSTCGLLPYLRRADEGHAALVGDLNGMNGVDRRHVGGLCQLQKRAPPDLDKEAVVGLLEAGDHSAASGEDLGARISLLLDQPGLETSLIISSEGLSTGLCFGIGL